MHVVVDLVAVAKYIIRKQPSCKKKVCGPQEGHYEKRCEIQGSDQEMDVMVG